MGLVERWERYWFAPGGRTSLAVLRIAVALSIWISLDQMASTWVHSPSYRAIGLWRLLGDGAPSAGFVSALWWIARISTVAMALGALSRVSTIVSFVSACLLCALSYSGFPSWSHAYNAVLLAHLALVGARTGDALSIDSLIWKNRESSHGYQWSIRLAQLAIAMMFISGMFHKVWRGYPTLDWALSDNLRHHLLVHFDASGLPRTAVADWIIDDVWKYRGAALGNLISQTIPLFACFLVRRPLLRAVCGGFFVLEVLALGFVMALWNYQWLPLAVVFIDWEWILRRPAPDRSPVAAPRRMKLAISIFVAVFVALDVFTSLAARIDQKLNLYPFSGFPMFASLRVRTPTSEHLPYSFEGGHIEILAATPAPASIELELDRFYDKHFKLRDRDKLKARLTEILESAKRLYPATQGVRLHWTIYEAPAYPAPARIERKPIAILAELLLDGTYRSQLASAPPVASAAITTYADAIPTAHAYTGEAPSGGRAVYVLDDGTHRWVVFQAKR